MHRVLQHLIFDGVPLEESHLFQRAAFLLALVIGYRASQLAALTKHSSFSHLEEDSLSLTLTPLPNFLVKNEQGNNLISLIRIPTFLEDEGPHPFCPA